MPITPNNPFKGRGFVAKFRKKLYRLLEVGDCRSRLCDETEQPGNKVSLADGIPFASHLTRPFLGHVYRFDSLQRS